MEDTYEKTVKAPHLFLVHFIEHYVDLTNTGAHGKAHIVICDGFSHNVYGFKSDEEAQNFDPLHLRSILRGGRKTAELFKAQTEEELKELLANDKRFKLKVLELDTNYPGGPIENLPTCKRMYIGKESNYLYCGKPTRQCEQGGCVLENYDQDDVICGMPCPLKKYYKERFEQTQKAYQASSV